MRNDRKSNKIITKKRNSSIPEGENFETILKRNNIDINDSKQLETYMRSRGFSDSSIRKSLRGARQYKTNKGDRNFHFDNKDGGFRIFNDEGGEITKENRKSGNRQGFGLGDLVGLGNDVSSFAGVVKDLRMREYKAEREKIGELDRVKSKGGVEAPTAPKNLSTPEVKLGGGNKGVRVGSDRNTNVEVEVAKGGSSGDDDFMLLTEKERAQRSFDEQLQLDSEGIIPVPNRLIPLKGSDPFDFENPRGGPVGSSTAPKTEQELHEIGRQETLNKFSDGIVRFRNAFGVVSTKQEDDIRKAAVQERIKRRTEAMKNRLNTTINYLKKSNFSKSIVDGVRGN